MVRVVSSSVDDGKPNVATPEATMGLQTLTDWFKDGHIPKAAITWTEEEGRKAFQDGELIFHRNWALRIHLATKTDGSSKITASSMWRRCLASPQPGVSSLGGAQLTRSPRTRRTRVRRSTS